MASAQVVRHGFCLGAGDIGTRVWVQGDFAVEGLGVGEREVGEVGGVVVFCIGEESLKCSERYLVDGSNYFRCHNYGLLVTSNELKGSAMGVEDSVVGVY